MIEFIIAMIVSVVGLLVYRRMAVLKKNEELREQLPIENHLYFYGTKEPVSSIDYIMQIDENAIESLESMYVFDLESFHDWYHYISDKYLEAVVESSEEDWMNRFQEMLEEQKGFPDHEHIFGYEELHPESIQSVTEEPFEIINDLHKRTGVSVPVAAIAISGYREFNLLIEEKTDRIRSIQNVVLDFAGTSGGGFAGARMGASIGKIAGPIGSAIGGILGAIGGAQGGRMFSNYFKFKHFKEAVQQYELQIGRSKRKIKQKQLEGQQLLEEAIVNINQQTNAEKTSIEAKYRKKMDDYKDDTIQKQKQLCFATPKILDAIKNSLQKKEQETFQNKSRTNLIKNWLVPTDKDILLREHACWFQRKYTIIDDVKQRFSVELEGPEESEQIQKRYAEILHFFHENPTADEDLLVLLSQLAEQDLDQHSKWAKKAMYQCIVDAEAKLREEATSIFESISMTIHEQTRVMQEKVNEVKAEATKLGKEV